MQFLEQVDASALRKHEDSLNPVPNVRLGSYGMPPPEQFELWRVTLEERDLDKMFVLFDFVEHTIGLHGKLSGIRPSGGFKERVEKKIQQNLDLRLSPKLAVVIVTVDWKEWPLILADGNHRATAQYLKHGTITGVPAFVCKHPNICFWTNTPIESRKRLAL
ncbi:MAG TPA: hypothetical protein VMV69_10320 [Pirellulales bacterium]|nr:hypothetical protein [Pirellulales bacterium]